MKLEDRSIEELYRIYNDTGHPEIISELLKKLRPLIFDKVSRYIKEKDLIEDITQEVLIKTFIHFKNFNGKSTFKTWVFSIVHNTSINHLKEKNKKLSFTINSKIIESVQDEVFENVDSKLELLKEHDLEEIIFELLNSLSPREKALFILRFRDQHPIKELITITGESESSIKMQIKRMKDKLTNLYKEY
ncbi:RNA polymerase sigma factor [Marinigracilibium pacificum]|uniref:RNA polymerase sigma factor n=1 Tax=Marinigracilibium pacificum TaxID=2729599 RepID=A0A848ISZ9_9BACT|nr:RNA polymerase sigma factor [Marinigracilibium pacificum]NMM47457.1 RNA polymerase sigma factor [Marinigracilibium pacificum]